MEVLLDTRVVSELLRPTPAPEVVAYVAGCRRPIVSAIIFHELAFGVERYRDKVGKARLESYLDRLKARFKNHVIEIDAEIFETAGRLRAAAVRRARGLSQFDSLIAASAISRSATLATRDNGDFDWMGIPIVDPWPQI